MNPRLRRAHSPRVLPALASLLLAAGSPSAFAAGLDSSFLKKSAPAPAASAKPVTAGPVKKGDAGDTLKTQMKETDAVQGVTDEDIKKNQEVIQSLTLLINNSRPGVQRQLLVLNRASAINLYVRQMLLRGKSLKIDERGKAFLQSARRDAESVIAAREATPDLKTRAHVILGFALIYLDLPNLAREHFIASLKANPKSENAGWMALFIAEDFFDAGKYADAITYYRNFYRQLSPQGQELASYKIAWSMVNLRENAKAEQIFTTLIRHDPKKGLGKDSIRDLAFLIAHKADPSEAIRVADTLFPNDNAARVEFLGYVRTSLESQGSPVHHDRIVDRILQIDTHLESRIQLLLANLRVHRKEVASHEHQAAFIRLRDQLHASKLSPQAPEFKKIETVLEPEVQGMLRVYIETFAGRMKSPEPYPRNEIVDALQSQFAFYTTYFPKSTAAPQVTSLWMDICTDTKNWACIDHVAESMFANRSVYGTAAVEKAAVNQLAAIDELIVKAAPPRGAAAPAAPPTALEARRLAKMKGFLTEFPKSDQWLRVAKAYAQLLGDRATAKAKENPPKAGEVSEETKAELALLDQIFAREKSADAFYRLQYLRFQGGDFAGVLADTRDAKLAPAGKPDPRMADLRRESSLALAAAAKKSEDFDTYRRNIQAFLASKPDEAKAKVAREDYFRFLLKKDRVADLHRELLALPVSMRYSKELQDLIFATWIRELESGSPRDALALLRDPAPAGAAPAFAQDLIYRRLITSMIMGQAPHARDLADVAPDKRDYLLGLLVLLQPETVLQYIEGLKNRGEGERELAALALRLTTRQVAIARSERAYRLLGRGYAFASADTTVTLPIEKRIAGVRVPDLKKLKPAQQGKAIEKLVGDVQAVRAAVPKEIAGKPPELQARAVLAARDLEAKTAAAILGSPIPKQLAPAQVNEYKAGLAEAAKEFQTQAGEFEKLAASVRASMDASHAKLHARILARPEMAKWKWPGGYPLDAGPAKDPGKGGAALLRLAAAQAKAGNYGGALVLLDYIRGARATASAGGGKDEGSAAPEGMRDDNDYFRIRAGYLLASDGVAGAGNEALRFYVLNELEKNQQEAVINDWKALLPPPAPEATAAAPAPTAPSAPAATKAAPSAAEPAPAAPAASAPAIGGKSEDNPPGL